MNSDMLINIEKKAILITLTYLSNNSKLTIINKSSERIYNIENQDLNLNYEFNITPKIDCNDILIKLLKKVCKDYKIEYNEISTTEDFLNMFAKLSNKISKKIVEDLSSKITLVNSSYYELFFRLRQVSDNCTITLIKNNISSDEEKTIVVLVRHLIDNIITHFTFMDGMDLLSFINGTRIIVDILSKDTSLYNDNLNV